MRKKPYARNEFLRSLGLDRRAEVWTRFGHAKAAVQHLFTTLAREADDEAVAKGIDADVKPEAVSGQRIYRWTAKSDAWKKASGGFALATKK